MSAGAGATREHHVVDATHTHPTGEVDPFADFDPYDLGDLRPTTDRRPAAERRPTSTELPVVDARRPEPVRRDPDRPTHYDVDDAHAWDTDAWHDDSWDDLDDLVPGVANLDAAFAPTIDAGRDDRAPRGGIDPLLARIGAVAVVATMLVPLAVAMSSDDGTSDLLAAVTTATSEPVVEMAVDPTAPAATDAAPTSLDVSDLPLAVPVNTAAGSSDDVAATPEVARAESTTGDDAAAGGATATDTTGAANDRASDASARPTAASTSTGATTASADDADAIATTAAADDVAERTEAICAVDYTVVEGDFWIRLADAAGVDLADLLDANDATVNTPLFPGRPICLPAGAQTPAPPTTTATTVEATTTTTSTTTTAPATTSTTTTVVTTPAGPADVEQIIRDIWPDELEDRALEIAYRESRYVPTAKNYCCYGLFQIYWSVHQGWLAGIGITDDQQLYDPATNARAALALYERAGGWGPWGF